MRPRTEKRKSRGDYTATSGLLTFPVGPVVEQDVSIETNDDDLNEGDERFTVTLETAPGSEVELNASVHPTDNG